MTTHKIEESIKTTQKTTPIWKIIIWEDLDETNKITSKNIKGEYAEILEEAEKKLQFYKSMPDVFKVSHFTIE